MCKLPHVLYGVYALMFMQGLPHVYVGFALMFMWGLPHVYVGFALMFMRE